MSDPSAKRPKFRPNPKRQVILIVLAVLGLAAGYGLGYLFQPERGQAPPPADPTPARTSSPAPAEPAPSAPPKTAQPSPVLPEENGPESGPVRAYEEALPKEIVVTVERIGPLPPAAVAPARTPAPEPAPEKARAAESETTETAAAPSAPAPPPAPPAAAPAPLGPPPPWRAAAVPVRPDGRPMIAIVIDDLGIDKARTRRTIQLPAPLSMSFLTYATKLEAQTRAARDAGHELWMHVPMEPSLASVDPGPHALLTSLGGAAMQASLASNLDSFSGYVGINNHMGSRFTAHRAGMDRVMAELRKRGLAFLDSVTSPKSTGTRAARAAGVAHAVRNIFIDHEDDLKVITAQFQRIERLARQQGHAIAIGHPREKTLKALKPWLEGIEGKGFQLVPVSALLRLPAAPGAGD